MIEITEQELMNITMIAASRVYLSALIKNTPGEGNVAGAWDIDITSDGVRIFNEEFGDVVTFLEEGTDPHEIHAKDSGFLKFPKGEGTYTGPKKKIPGNIAFEKDGFIFAKAVYHPGIEARRFVENVLNDTSLEQQFDKELETLLKQKLQL